MASTSKQMTQKFGKTTATTTTVLNDNSCQMIPANGPFGNKTIGPRTVIVMADPLEWNEGTSYEYLTLVINNGNSYISKKDVPAGTPVTNKDYWVKSSDWNAQLDNIQNDIDTINDNIDIIFNKVNGFATPQMFGAVGDGSTDDSDAFNAMFSSEYTSFYIPDKIYIINKTVNLKPNIFVENHGSLLIGENAQLYLAPNQASNYKVMWNGGTIRVNGNRTTYGICLYDLVYSVFTNLMVRTDDGSSKYNGMYIAQNLAPNTAWDNVIQNCHFQKACLTLENSTDNIIANNKLWANFEPIENNSNALRLNKNCGNCVIANNHFITSQYGSMFYSEQSEGLRFINNYFDGGHSAISASVMDNCEITGNLFFNVDISPMYVEYLRGSVISNNTFENTARMESGYTIPGTTNAIYADINAHLELIGCIVSNNIHRRTLPDTWQTNPTTMFYVDPSASNGASQTILTNCVGSFEKSFGTLNYDLPFLHVTNIYPELRE